MGHARAISVIGLGYVGLPVAIAFARSGTPVVGFDANSQRISDLKSGFDRTGENSQSDLKSKNLTLTSDSNALRAANFHIITAPTPIDETNRPILTHIIAASQTVGSTLKKGDIVVYESTVYPGATEEDCVPVLEHTSGLTYGQDFTVGYAPERINPGDSEHTFINTTKIVSGSDANTLDIIAKVYQSVVTAGTHKAPSIRVAEAAKIIEDTQRDVNIGLMNELAVILHRLDVDTHDALAACQTKWNFLHFSPGLVGGTGTATTPYHLIHQAEKARQPPGVIMSSRRSNEETGRFIARETIKSLMTSDCDAHPVVTILGLTFKENIPDIRNTKVMDIVHELKAFGAVVQVTDSIASATEVAHAYDLNLTPFGALKPADAVILAVPHHDYIALGWDITRLLKPGPGFVADVKGILDRNQRPDNITLWRL